VTNHSLPANNQLTGFAYLCFGQRPYSLLLHRKVFAVQTKDFLAKVILDNSLGKSGLFGKQKYGTIWQVPKISNRVFHLCK
jgi:hypothetical protein